MIKISQDEKTKPEMLKKFLMNVVEEKHGYSLGEPWKYSENALLVVVPVIRKKSPKRKYTTMYEVLKDLGMKDTGHIDKVELQNKTGTPIFVRAGTIFAGKTQNRAAQHSGIYKPNSKTDVPVRCVQQTHGISPGTEMEYGSIAPMSVTLNLMVRDQGAVWSSVRNYTTGIVTDTTHGINNDSVHGITGFIGISGYSGSSNWTGCEHSYSSSSYTPTDTIFTTCSETPIATKTEHRNIGGTTGSDDLLGYLNNKNREELDNMMQQVPLFDDQAGAIIFDPLGVIAIETFDHPKSWEAIKKEVMEKYGDKVKDEQAEHLFELNPDMIVPLLKKFVSKLDNFEEKTISQDDSSETRVVKGDGVVGEYTLINNDVIHCLIIKE